MDRSLENLAREEQRRYQREWRRRNKDRVREINRRYWERRAKRRIEDHGGGEVQ